MSRCITIALSGNPNSGKTTIFNNLTGTRQKVGNWPGVTVEKKEGLIHRGGFDLKIVDLPGTYSLTPFSIEEIVARDYVLDERPDVVIDIIDASNLERSLYLATQLRELGRSKVLFALNMSDVAQARGFKIDEQKLSELLDVPVVSTIGNKNQGVEHLLDRALELALADKKTALRRKVRYSQDIEAAIRVLEENLSEATLAALDYDRRWTAIKLLENDSVIRQRVLDPNGAPAGGLAAEVDRQRHRLAQRYNDDPEIVMTDERYGFIAGIMKEVFSTSSRGRADVSRTIDLVLTNRFIGFPIFLFFIWAMFQLTFTLGAYPMEWIEGGVEVVSSLAERLLPASLLRDLLVDGILAGVGSVIVFLPNILILFFCIALFEDTGYMARSAFLMDKIMHLIGLHGKSFIPMLMGFGCNVPAIMAARTLESEKDRVLTILITPFMSCSARLPVYIVLAGAFFEAHAGTLIFAVYVLGIVTAILMGRLFRSTLLRGADAPFVMELPPYRVPMVKSLMIHMWDRSKMFLKKMAGVILVGSVLVWALSSFPRQVDFARDYDEEMQQVQAAYALRLAEAPPEEHAGLSAEREARLQELRRSRQAEMAEKSFMGRLGRAVEPVFTPLGIDWRGGVALLTGFVAKEIVVSTMAVLYAVEDEQGADALSRALSASGMTPLAALSMMVFVLLYVPCLATIAAIRRETGSLRWTLFSVVYMTAVAWLLAFATFQGGRLLGFQ